MSKCEDVVGRMAVYALIYLNIYFIIYLILEGVQVMHGDLPSQKSDEERHSLLDATVSISSM